jgi:hypothetical protein
VPETVVEATVETVDGKRAAAKSASRQSGRTETSAPDPGRTKTAPAHPNPATAKAAAVEAATKTATATAAETATTTTKATAGRSRVRRQHGDRRDCEQGDHYCA